MVFAVGTSGAIGLNTVGSHFYIMTIRNNSEFHKAGNDVLLAGDTQRASLWIAYAQRQLVNLKTWMRLAGSNMGKKIYTVDAGCVDIIIQSVASMDKVYIRACPEGKCKSKVRIISNVGDTISIGVTPLDIPDTLYSPLVMVFWGDTYSTRSVTAENNEEQVFTYKYKTSATYSIKVVVAERVSAREIVPTSTYTSYYREAPSDYTSYEEAHAVCLALPWGVVDNTLATVESRGTGSGDGSGYGWKMGKVVLTFDTSEIPSSAMFDIHTAHGNANNNNPVSFPVMRIDGVNNGAFANRPHPPFPIRQSQGFDPMPTNLTQIEFGDNNEYEFVNEIGFFTSGTNIQSGFFPIDCKVTKTLSAKMVF